MPTLSRSEFAVKRATIHGHEMSYRLAGDGPVVVLVHGLACSSTTWKDVMPALAETHTVLAPDLLGHGESAKPRSDYSLGAYASSIRDLMVTLGIDHATLVGHSFGGGVAMQLSYQFPERCERLVLVASGGLGREVHPLLRAVTLPAAEYVLPLLLTSWLRLRAEAAGDVLRRVGWKPGSSLSQVWRSYTTLTTAEGQRAFVQTVRSVIDLAGQRVSAADRLYLAAAVPTLIVWGDDDAVIPVTHAHAAHEAIPGSRLEVLPGGGHFLPWRDAEWFTGVLRDFLSKTTPARAAAGLSR